MPGLTATRISFPKLATIDQEPLLKANSAPPPPPPPRIIEGSVTDDGGACLPVTPHCAQDMRKHERGGAAAAGVEVHPFLELHQTRHSYGHGGEEKPTGCWSDC